VATLKTRPTGASVAAFLAAIPDPDRRRECRALAAMLRRVTRVAPKMWGASIVGYGSYHYRYATGREGDWFLAGFSPRKQDLTVYVMAGLHRAGPLLRKLGRHRAGRGCLYLKRLGDVDPKVLEALITDSVRTLRRTSVPAPRTAARRHR